MKICCTRRFPKVWWLAKNQHKQEVPNNVSGWFDLPDLTLTYCIFSNGSKIIFMRVVACCLHTDAFFVSLILCIKLRCNPIKIYQIVQNDPKQMKHNKYRGCPVSAAGLYYLRLKKQNWILWILLFKQKAYFYTESTHYCKFSAACHCKFFWNRLHKSLQQRVCCWGHKPQSLELKLMNYSVWEKCQSCK